MSSIRPELSEKNEYYIERHRYYELKHFCLQYPIWHKAYLSLDSLAKRPYDLMLFNTNNISSPTERCAFAREYYKNRMTIIEKSCKQTDAILGEYILKAVTEGCSYEILRTRYNIPCCKDTYYKLYRKFFWVLNKNRE